MLKEVKEDAIVRSESETEGFLEAYSENYITLGRVDEIKKEKKEKEVQTMRIVKPDVIVGEEIVANTENKKLNEEVKELLKK